MAMGDGITSPSHTRIHSHIIHRSEFGVGWGSRARAAGLLAPRCRVSRPVSSANWSLEVSAIIDRLCYYVATLVATLRHSLVMCFPS